MKPGQPHLIFEQKPLLFWLRPALYAQDPCDLNEDRELDSAHKAQDPCDLNEDRELDSAHKARNVGILTVYRTIRCVYPDHETKMKK